MLTELADVSAPAVSANKVFVTMLNVFLTLSQIYQSLVESVRFTSKYLGWNPVYINGPVALPFPV